MAINLDVLLISIIVNIVIISPSLWLAGRLIVGRRKAKFIDAIWIVVLGVVIGAIFRYFFTGVLAALIQLAMWLGLVKHFFDATRGQAIAIAIVAVIVFIVASIVLGLVLGFTIFTLLI